MANITGIEEIKSMKTTGSRSMPPNMSEPYINLYMLSKEKERLEKERIRLDTRIEWVVRRLKEIEKEIERLEKQDKKVQKKRKFDLDTSWVKKKKRV